LNIKCDFDLWLIIPLVVKKMRYYVTDFLKYMENKQQ
jgi:hypothetical protein